MYACGVCVLGGRAASMRSWPCYGCRSCICCREPPDVVTAYKRVSVAEDVLGAGSNSQKRSRLDWPVLPAWWVALPPCDCAACCPCPAGHHQAAAHEPTWQPALQAVGHELPAAQPAHVGAAKGQRGSASQPGTARGRDAAGTVVSEMWKACRKGVSGLVENGVEG